MTEKIKVVSKKQIEEVLFEGGYVRWYSGPWAKAELLNNKREVVGTIRFDTYIKLDLREENMKMPAFVETQDGSNSLINDAASPFWRLKRWDAWQGYDDYQLRPAVMNHPEHKQFYLKRIWR